MVVRRGFIYLAVLISCATVRSAVACVPLPDYSSDPEYLQGHAGHIFLGRVRSVSIDEARSRATIKFQVSRVWKGSRKSVRTVMTSLDDATCGLGSNFFVKGKAYLVYADRSTQGITTTTLSGSKEKADAKADLTFLGRGKRVP